jgi:hypothetical protein
MPEEIDDRSPMASTIAVKHIFDPKKENLVDVSQVPVGMVNSLTKMRAYTSQIKRMIDTQIRPRQLAYITEQVRREFIKREWVVEEVEDEKTKKKVAIGKWVVSQIPDDNTLNSTIQTRYEALIKDDEVDITTLFLDEFLDAYCHTSRGKNAFLLEKGVDLAVSDIETRDPNSFNEPAVPRRS